MTQETQGWWFVHDPNEDGKIFAVESIDQEAGSNIKTIKHVGTFNNTEDALLCAFAPTYKRLLQKALEIFPDDRDHKNGKAYWFDEVRASLQYSTPF